jgi:CRISPR/Cas system CSM-associated protein Csm2 small subunit
MVQSIEAFLREKENEKNPLSKVLEKVLISLQDDSQSLNDMELFMNILKELDGFI